MDDGGGWLAKPNGSVDSADHNLFSIPVERLGNGTKKEKEVKE